MNDSHGGNDAADQALLRWLTRLGHDLRSPLSPIRSATDLLRSGGIDAATRIQFLDVIDRQVSLLVAMAEAISDVAHGIRGDWTLNRQRLELGVLFELAADRSGRHLHEAGIVLEIGELGPIHVVADLERSAHLLEMLVRDAASRVGRGDHIALEAREQDGAVTITLAHPGVPPEPDLLERLPAVSSIADDPCLGSSLFVAARLARAMGGALKLTAGEGARATVLELQLPAG
ncbi:MAG TPA: hypothetical protein VFG21_02410 [Xanthomonadaceae bacterium]|nr:hypothetical protein [Xanthomonadaceae bacterium]